jgi:endo-1,4-beta-xylanase
VAAVAVPVDGWVRLSGDYMFRGDVSELQLYAESDEESAAYFLDDVSVTTTAPPSPEDTGLTSTFDGDDTQGWGARGGVERVAVSTADAHSGTGSLLTTGRTASWMGPAVDVLDRVTLGNRYAVSLWAKLAPGAPASSLRVSVERRLGTQVDYDLVVSDTPVTDAGWVNLRGGYVLARDVDFLSLYVESAGGTAPFLVDDVAVTYQRPVPVQTDIPALRDVLAGDFDIGAAIGRQETVGGHADLVRRHFSSVTPGNALKWDATEPAEGRFSFEEADAQVVFARANGLKVRGHTLVWHSQAPAWVFQDTQGRELTPGPEARALVLARLERHIRTVAGRYADDVYAWDVANEVIDEAQSDGLRRSRWFELTGLDYLRTAFRVAREVTPRAALFINDYNTTQPRKRQALFELTRRLRAEGVPVDGVGHQMHIDIEKPSPAEIEQTIVQFAGLGVDQQVTELDMSIYDNVTQRYTSVPPEVLLVQGHRYRDVFDVFRRQRAHLSNVTFWGSSDDTSWLRSFPITRLNAPLLFDEQLQAKPAYWGVVDPTRLEPLTRSLRAPAGRIRVDARSEPEWELLPATRITAPNGLSAAFRVRWGTDRLHLLIDVVDPSNDRTDTVEVFAGDRRYGIQRGGTGAQGFPAKVRRTADSYRVEASVPLPDAAEGMSVPFDLRVRDASRAGEPVSFNDVRHRQDGEPGRWGRLALTAAVPRADVTRGTATVDGVVDGVWAGAATVATGRQVTGRPGATADVKLLWDPGHLYVLATVRDDVLSDASANAWEQDSVELFVDPDNAKTTGYADDDGQYRISFRNTASVTGNFDAYAIADNLRSSTRVVPGGYVVEASIEVDTVDVGDGTLLGFEVQVNDDATGQGARTGVAGWADGSGRSYLDTSGWGVLRLVQR